MLNRPQPPETQCPSCHLESLGPICGGKKRRINQNEKGEYFKAIDCQLWVERRIIEAPDGKRICPTCGQVIPDGPTVQEKTLDADIQDTVNKAFNHIVDNAVLLSPGSIFDWGDVSSGATTLNSPDLTMSEPLPLEPPAPPEPPEPEKKKRKSPGRGFDDFPRARKKRRVAA